MCRGVLGCRRYCIHRVTAHPPARIIPPASPCHASERRMSAMRVVTRATAKPIPTTTVTWWKRKPTPEKQAAVPVVPWLPGCAKERMRREDDEERAVDFRHDVLCEVLHVVVCEEEPACDGRDPCGMALPQEGVEDRRRDADDGDVQDGEPAKQPQPEEPRDDERQPRRTPRAFDVLACPVKTVRDPVVGIGGHVGVAPVQIRHDQ